MSPRKKFHGTPKFQSTLFSMERSEDSKLRIASFKLHLCKLHKTYLHLYPNSVSSYNQTYIFAPNIFCLSCFFCQFFPRIYPKKLHKTGTGNLHGNPEYHCHTYTLCLHSADKAILALNILQVSTQIHYQTSYNTKTNKE